MSDVIFNITPIPKPRMTRADSWKKRPVVLSYWAYKDEINLWANKTKICISTELNVTFILPMPKSWSCKKKMNMNGKPHTQKPDWDNLAKGLQDCLLKNDSGVHRAIINKVWGYEGKIIFHT